jgi:hypothetical protein
MLSNEIVTPLPHFYFSIESLPSKKVLIFHHSLLFLSFTKSQKEVVYETVNVSSIGLKGLEGYRVQVEV